MSAPLFGDRLVRLAFLDEAGRSESEPFLVVAGVIVHGDRDYRRIEDAPTTLIQAEIPARHRSRGRARRRSADQPHQLRDLCSTDLARAAALQGNLGGRREPFPKSGRGPARRWSRSRSEPLGSSGAALPGAFGQPVCGIVCPLCGGDYLSCHLYQRRQPPAHGSVDNAYTASSGGR
jgi:hypothetical protein